MTEALLETRAAELREAQTFLKTRARLVFKLAASYDKQQQMRLADNLTAITSSNIYARTSDRLRAPIEGVQEPPAVAVCL